MEYSRIVAVTGMPGLYEVLNSKTDGAVVRSLEDKSTKFVSSRVHNLSHLESIEVYTVKENATLSDVFSAMKTNQTKLPDVKDNIALKAYFETVYPELDFERVYVSDMKKMVKWFEVLTENNVDFATKPEEETAGEVVETASAEEPATKTKTKVKATAETAITEEEKPKKTRKKKTEE